MLLQDHPAPLPLRMQIPQSPPQRLTKLWMLVTNVQFAIDHHAAGVDVGRAVCGVDVIDDHQLGVDVNRHPGLTSRRVEGDQ